MYSPRQVAKAIGVSEASLKRWCDRGLLPVQRTAGGHRRISKRDVLTFLRERRQDLQDPTVLGLPETVAKTQATHAPESLIAGFLADDENALRGLFTSWFLAGRPLTTLFDEGVSPAFHRLGAMWQSGAIEVYQERRSVELCRRALYELTLLLPEPAADAPLALGAGLQHDPYELANLMVEATLREMGWQAETLGTDLPGDTIAAAVATRRPRLLWLSVAGVADEAAFVRAVDTIWQACLQHKTRLAMGGRGLSDALRGKVRYTVYCAQISDLVDFLRSTD